MWGRVRYKIFTKTRLLFYVDFRDKLSYTIRFIPFCATLIFLVTESRKYPGLNGESCWDFKDENFKRQAWESVFLFSFIRPFNDFK